MDTAYKCDEYTVRYLMQALKDHNNGISCIIRENTPQIQFVGNGKYIVIQDF